MTPGDALLLTGLIAMPALLTLPAVVWLDRLGRRWSR